MGLEKCLKCVGQNANNCLSPGDWHALVICTSFFCVPSSIAEFLQWIGMVFIKTTTLFYMYPPQFSCFIVSASLRPHGLQHTRPPCPSPTPGVYSNSCPLSRWCHPTIWSSVVPFSCLQSFPASGTFQMSQLFASGVQSTGVSTSASVIPMNIQNWSPLGWTGWISFRMDWLDLLAV